MSIIYQALKKAEGERYRSTAMESSFKKKGLALRPVLVQAIFLPLMLAFYLLQPSKETLTVQRPKVTLPKAPEARLPPAEVSDGLEARGIEEYAKGRFEEAESYFRRSADEKSSASAYSNLGLSSMRLGRKREAEAAFRKALELDPGHPQALNNYACLLAEAGKKKQALAMLEKAAANDPQYADAHFNLAVVLEKNGDLDRALPAYEDFLRLAAPAEAAGVRRKLMALRSEVIVRQAGGR